MLVPRWRSPVPGLCVVQGKYSTMRYDLQTDWAQIKIKQNQLSSKASNIVARRFFWSSRCNIFWLWKPTLTLNLITMQGHNKECKNRPFVKWTLGRRIQNVPCICFRLIDSIWSNLPCTTVCFPTRFGDNRDLCWHLTCSLSVYAFVNSMWIDMPVWTFWVFSLLCVAG